MAANRKNALNQALDIAGSLLQSSSLTLGDESLGLGSAVSGQSGSTASIASIGSGIITISGVAGFSSADIGNFITISGANTSANNGTFLITAVDSSTQIKYANGSGVAPDSNNGSIVWKERVPYSLQDDLNYERTDRAAIKGVAYTASIPTYTRPTATGTSVDANLNNIAGKTTDARGFIINRAFYNITVASTNTLVTISSAGNLKHSDSTDKTGVPVFDTGPYVSDYKACYVEINDGYTDNELTVQSGGHKGEKIYGLAYNGSSTSPNSIEIRFFSVPHGSDLATGSTAYTWEAALTTKITAFYGFFQRLDQISDDSFRTVFALGLQSDADLRQDLNDTQAIIGNADGATSLNILLTNISANYPFFNLPDATPSVVEAFNTLNSQIGDRTYSGGILSSGQTIVASLQALSNAIAAAGAIIRTIERLGSDITANTAHTLPGGITYTLDGADNGAHLWLYTRGLLRDPGSVANGNDYSETSTTSVTFYATQKSGDHINYFTS